MTQHTQGGRRWRGGVAALLTAGLAASCVNQQDYDDALRLVKQYQTENADLEDELARLRQQNARLDRMVRDGTIDGLQGDLTQPLEARLDNLQSLLDELDRPPADIEKFTLAEGYLYMIQDRILFESGKADLGAEGKKALLEISREIAATPHGTVYVRGHTDSDPVKKPETVQRFPHGNIQLSAARAVAVAALLIDAGDIPEKDVRVMGFGPHEPVAPNDSSGNKRLNRRVEIFVANPGT